jgi:hypothetical protein
MVMAHNMDEFWQAVRYYKQELKRVCVTNATSIFIILDFEDVQGFYSLAPLSHAAHELGADVHFKSSSRKSKLVEALLKVWEAYSELEAGMKTKGAKALARFISAVERRTNQRNFRNILKPPDIIILSEHRWLALQVAGQKFLLEKRWQWRSRKAQRKLKDTATNIVKNAYSLRSTESFAVSMELVPGKPMLELPLEDYLDNFLIARTMAEAGVGIAKECSVGASTRRRSKVEPMERISELSATLLGCSNTEHSEEPVFKTYLTLKETLKLPKLKPADAVFAIIGKGYGGKHFFGVRVGYPAPDNKTRWDSPGLMFLKPWWTLQTPLDPRKPKTRYGITETLPVERFVESCDVDVDELIRRNRTLVRILKRAQYVVVDGSETRFGKTSLRVWPRYGKRKSRIMPDDMNARSKIDREAKKYGVLAGTFVNFPAGETFFTPANIEGTIIGDVVINIDQSYVLSEQDPVVANFKAGNYKFKRVPRKLDTKVKKELKDVRKLIRELEKSKSLPEEVIEAYKKNLRRVGEFAINTNPKAKLGRYLIENEKIARMIHVALGSGFEPGSETLYHWDIVINAPKQRLDIYAVDGIGKKHWIMRKGVLLV